MKKYIVTYDLCSPGQNYDGLITKIESFNHTKIAKSAWVITSSKTAIEIRDILEHYIDDNDVLFVAALTGEAAWHGLTKVAGDWLHQNLNR